MGFFDRVAGGQKNNMNNNSNSNRSAGTGLSVIEERHENNNNRNLNSKGSNGVMRSNSRSASRPRPSGKTGLNSNGISFVDDKQESSDDGIDSRSPQTVKVVSFKDDNSSINTRSSSDESHGSGWSNKGGYSGSDSEYSTTSTIHQRNDSKIDDKVSIVLSCLPKPSDADMILVQRQ